MRPYLRLALIIVLAIQGLAWPRSWGQAAADQAKEPKAPAPAESPKLQGRPLDDWFAELIVRTRDPELVAKRTAAEEALVAAAAKEPEISRLALRHYGDSRISETTLERIVNAAGKTALPAIYEQLSNKVERRAVDRWAIERLRKGNDTSPEAMAALVACLYTMDRDRPSDWLAEMAAVRLGEIGLPALAPLLCDRQREGEVAFWSKLAIEKMGVAATDKVLAYSIEHPDDFLAFPLGSYCRKDPAAVAPKLAAVLKSKEQVKAQRGALRALCEAVEPKVESYKRTPIVLPGEGIAELALPFLDEPITVSTAAKVIAGFTPRSPAVRERVVALFVPQDAPRSRLIWAIASFDTLPDEVALPLLEMHDELNYLHLEPWRRALGKLSDKGKSRIAGEMKKQSTRSPAAAAGMTGLDPSPAMRDEMRKTLNEMELGGEDLPRKVDALRKWLPDLAR